MILHNTLQPLDQATTQKHISRTCTTSRAAKQATSPACFPVKSLLENGNMVRMSCQRCQGTACSICKEAQAGTRDAGNTRARTSTCRHLEACLARIVYCFTRCCLSCVTPCRRILEVHWCEASGDVWDRNPEKPLS